MALEQIGLQAIFDDKNFQAGIKRYQDGIGQATSATDKGASAMSAIGSVMKGALVAGIGAATVAFTAFVTASKLGLDATMQWQESLHTMVSQFGMTADQASTWVTAMEHVGLTVDEGSFGLRFFINGLSAVSTTAKDGTTTLTPFGKALQKLGVNAYDSKGKLKDFNTIMPEIMDRFSKLPEGIDASAEAMDLFGARGGTKFLEFLREGSKGLAEAQKRAHAFGLDLSDKDIQAIEDFKRALNDTADGLKGFWTQIGIHVLPIAKRLVDYINSKVIPVFVQWARDNMPKITAKLKEFWEIIQIKVLPILSRAWDAIQLLVKAFQKGGLSGVIEELTRQFQNLGNSDIGKSFEGWKTQFWNWLTGPGGALEQAGAQLGKVGAAIQDWLTKNGPAIAAKFDEFKLRFWDWLTGTGGVTSQIGTKFTDLMTAIDKWARGDGGKQLSAAGEKIGSAIGDGIVTLLGLPKTAADMAGDKGLSGSVDQSKDTFVLVGEKIGGGIIEGIQKKMTERGGEIDWGDILKVGAIGVGAFAGVKGLAAIPGFLATQLSNLMRTMFLPLVSKDLSASGFGAGLGLAIFGGIDIGTQAALWMEPWTNQFVEPFQKSMESLLGDIPVIGGITRYMGSFFEVLAGGILVVAGMIDTIKQLIWIGWDVLTGNFDNATKAAQGLGDTFATVQAGALLMFTGAGSMVSVVIDGLTRVKNAFNSAMLWIMSVVGNAFSYIGIRVWSGMQSVSNTITNTWNNIKIWLSRFSLFNIGVNIIQSLIDGLASRLASLVSVWNQIQAILGQKTTSTNAIPSSGAPFFQHGGIMPYTGFAYLHAGERVIPAPSVNNSRVNNLNFYHNWPAAVPTSARGWTEQMVRMVTQQEIAGVLGKI